MTGLLLVDKLAGWTSFDAVNYVRKTVAAAQNVRPKQIKVGHSGTLDPFATGLLLLLIGKDYTKQAASLTKLDKTYELTMHLGANSSTGDPEGEITPVNDKQPSRAELQAAAAKFIGQIEQTPPAYSAVKVGGQRAYKLARAGQPPVIKPRQVSVNRLELVSYDYPSVKLIADVSSGTYIRALVEDMGRALGSGAYTTRLRRTRVGSYSVEQAIDIKELSAMQLSAALRSQFVV